jgi:hypothetical protein
MAVGLEEILGSLSWSQRFFRAHLNGIQDEQWDWKPFPACRSIREILVHWAEYISADDTALRLALEMTTPDVAVVQRLMKEAGARFGDRYRQQYADTPMDAPYRNAITVGYVLAGLSGEDNYHAGQVAFIRLATDPDWDWVKAVHQSPEI